MLLKSNFGNPGSSYRGSGAEQSFLIGIMCWRAVFAPPKKQHQRPFKPWKEIWWCSSDFWWRASCHCDCCWRSRRRGGKNVETIGSCFLRWTSNYTLCHWLRNLRRHKQFIIWDFGVWCLESDNGSRKVLRWVPLMCILNNAWISLPNSVTQTP